MIPAWLSNRREKLQPTRSPRRQPIIGTFLKTSPHSFSLLIFSPRWLIHVHASDANASPAWAKYKKGTSAGTRREAGCLIWELSLYNWHLLLIFFFFCLLSESQAGVLTQNAAGRGGCHHRKTKERRLNWGAAALKMQLCTVEQRQSECLLHSLVCDHLYIKYIELVGIEWQGPHRVNVCIVSFCW